MKPKIKVCVIGQGYIGLPMSVAISNSRNKIGGLNFDVLGLEKNNAQGKYLQEKINSGIFPIKCEDKNIYKMFDQSKKNKNARKRHACVEYSTYYNCRRVLPELFLF